MTTRSRGLTRNLRVMLSEDDHLRLAEFAAAYEMTASEAIRRLIRAGHRSVPAFLLRASRRRR